LVFERFAEEESELMNSLIGRVVLPIGRLLLGGSRPVVNRTIMTTSKLSEKAMENLKTNPYFDKYSKKIASLQQ